MEGDGGAAHEAGHGNDGCGHGTAQRAVVALVAAAVAVEHLDGALGGERLSYLHMAEESVAPSGVGEGDEVLILRGLEHAEPGVAAIVGVGEIGGGHGDVAVETVEEGGVGLLLHGVEGHLLDVGYLISYDGVAQVYLQHFGLGLGAQHGGCGDEREYISFHDFSGYGVGYIISLLLSRCGGRCAPHRCRRAGRRATRCPFRAL